LYSSGFSKNEFKRFQEESLDIPYKTASSPPISSLHLQLLNQDLLEIYQLTIEIMKLTLGITRVGGRSKTGGLPPTSLMRPTPSEAPVAHVGLLPLLGGLFHTLPCNSASLRWITAAA